MAGKSTISITFKLDGDAKGFKELTAGADGLKAALKSTVSAAKELKGNVINFAALATGIDIAQKSFSQLHGLMQDLGDAYAVQVSAERRLETVMRQRMDATEAEIQSVKDLASAQQNLGIIGDEVQLSGIQQLATFLSLKSSIDVLVPAMNNLIAQQKGYNATTQDAVNIGNLIGKAMQGQTAALRRVGITFSEAEANVLKYGNESERAAMMAQVITNNVGNMNAELANTAPGKATQVANALGDIKEQIGGLVNGALPFVTIAAQSTGALAAISTLIAGIKTLTITLKANIKAFALSTATFIKNKAVTIATAVAQKTAAAATAIWTGAQKLLNMVMNANPIGIVITAIGAMVTALIYAYRNSETFRNVLSSLWSIIGPVANAIYNALGKALAWVAEKAKAAWDWLKNLLGLDGKQATVTANVKKNVDPGLKGLEKKYENGAVETKTSKSPNISSTALSVENKKVWTDAPKNIKEIQDNISILEDKILYADKSSLVILYRKKDLLEKMLEGYRDKKDCIVENTDKLKDEAAAAEENRTKWHANASTLQEYEDNVAILNEELKNATLAEAANINLTKKDYEEKIEAIKKAGIAVRQTTNVGDSLERGWGGLKGMTSSIEGMTNALQRNGNAWEMIVSAIDGFIGICRGISAVTSVIEMLTGATNNQTIAEQSKASATIDAAIADTAATDTEVANSAAKMSASGSEAAADTTSATAKVFKAHSSIPFVGVAIAAAMVATMLAAISKAKNNVPKFAKGGLAFGPSLGIFGEYPGAGRNPEVVAPLDKLRGMLAPAGNNVGKVEFKIAGRELVGILNKENNIRRRS